MTSTSEASRSAADRPAPQVSAISATDDVRTIMLNEISWGAVFAGAVIGLVVQLILNMVGIGVGLSTVNAVTGDSPSASSLSIGAGLWWVISGIVAPQQSAGTWRVDSPANRRIQRLPITA